MYHSNTIVKDKLRSLSRILVTGGAGFIGSSLISRLLKDTNAEIYNLDKLGYASDLSLIDNTLIDLKNSDTVRYQLLNYDLIDLDQTKRALEISKPDLILHLAAESHVDRSIDNPINFINNNIIGTFNLLQASKLYFDDLNIDKRRSFRFHHISTDEVFGSLDNKGKFDENTPYDPRSPYSASKASSDHLVKTWYHTYNLPVVISNCSNNFGPWQFPEKLIPIVVLNALQGNSIPLYGNGTNVRDWLFVEDHIDALILVATIGKIGNNYCIGGQGEYSNEKLVRLICSYLDSYRPTSFPYSNLINYVKDRPGHDQRYAIDSSKIMNELGWRPSNVFHKALEFTIEWYANNLEWCENILNKSNSSSERIGLGS